MSDPTIDREPSGSPHAAGDTLGDVVIYGDFSCPFSAVAHRRAVRRAEHDPVPLDFRTVEHDPEAVDGEVIEGESHQAFDDELAQIRAQLADGEVDDLRVPSRRLNTAVLNARYASLPPEQRAEFATAVFDAYWREGTDPNDPGTLERFAVTPTADGEGRARRWQREWEGFERHIVPMMRLADGKLSRGLGTLARLQ